MDKSYKELENYDRNYTEHNIFFDDLEDTFTIMSLFQNHYTGDFMVLSLPSVKGFINFPLSRSPKIKQAESLSLITVLNNMASLIKTLALLFCFFDSWTDGILPFLKLYSRRDSGIKPLN